MKCKSEVLIRGNGKCKNWHAKYFTLSWEGWIAANILQTNCKFLARLHLVSSLHIHMLVYMENGEINILLMSISIVLVILLLLSSNTLMSGIEGNSRLSPFADARIELLRW